MQNRFINFNVKRSARKKVLLLAVLLAILISVLSYLNSKGAFNPYEASSKTEIDNLLKKGNVIVKIENKQAYYTGYNFVKGSYANLKYFILVDGDNYILCLRPLSAESESIFSGKSVIRPLEDVDTQLIKSIAVEAERAYEELLPLFSKAVLIEQTYDTWLIAFYITAALCALLLLLAVYNCLLMFVPRISSGYKSLKRFDSSTNEILNNMFSKSSPCVIIEGDYIATAYNGKIHIGTMDDLIWAYAVPKGNRKFILHLFFTNKKSARAIVKSSEAPAMLKILEKSSPNAMIGFDKQLKIKHSRNYKAFLDYWEAYKLGLARARAQKALESVQQYSEQQEDSEKDFEQQADVRVSPHENNEQTMQENVDTEADAQQHEQLEAETPADTQSYPESEQNTED